MVLTGTPEGVGPLHSGDELAIGFHGQTLTTRVLYLLPPFRAAKLASTCQTGYKVQLYCNSGYPDERHTFLAKQNLDEMTDAEWESLCDGCGQCCLHKLMDEDTDEIYFTNVACKQLNIKTCQCRNYERRFEYEPDCIKLTRDNLPTFEWLPMTCAYRLLAEGKGCRTGTRY